MGEAEYAADHYVCSPGQKCTGRRSFAAFCAAVYQPPYGFAAVKFDVDLDGRMFYPCPRGISAGQPRCPLARPARRG